MNARGWKKLIYFNLIFNACLTTPKVAFIAQSENMAVVALNTLKLAVLIQSGPWILIWMLRIKSSNFDRYFDQTSTSDDASLIPEAAQNFSLGFA